ncbi:unnamed protein product, partial [Staurois parvus]
MSVAVSQFPPVSECPQQSRYKSLIVAITRITKKNSSICIPPFLNAITFMQTNSFTRIGIF